MAMGARCRVDYLAMQVYGTCMAVKTITIDMDAYERLAARKRPGESFSQVIKRTLTNERYTAANLLANMESVALTESALGAVDRIVDARATKAPAAHRIP